MLLWVMLTMWVVPASGLLVNNGVDGDPAVECGPTGVAVHVNTLNPFEGHIFVKGRFHDLGCRNSKAGERKASLRLGFEDCGVSRVRSLNPRGVFPLFVTKVDRAFKVQCFYMEADKTVEAEQILDVSFNLDGLSHLPEELVTAGVPMPVCRYEILEEGPEGRPIVFAEVGQAVYHKWTCDSETVDTFCMVIRDCFVDDKQGAKVDLINSFGCAEDRFLLNNIEYTSDLTAGVGTHVFKYADRPQLAFQCQISIFVKEPREACPRPYCAQPGGRGAGTENLVAGPPPPAPDHPFPLGPNSPYLPKEGSENVVQADPARNELSGRRANKPSSGGSAYESAEPLPRPSQAGQYGQEQPQKAGQAASYGQTNAASPYGQETPRSANPPSRIKEGWTAYEGPSLRSRLYNQYRSKRSLVSETSEAGVLDVRTELNALEVEDAVDELPSSLVHPMRSLGERRVCVSMPTLGVVLGAGGVFALAALGFLLAAALKSNKA